MCLIVSSKYYIVLFMLFFYSFFMKSANNFREHCTTLLYAKVVHITSLTTVCNSARVLF